MNDFVTCVMLTTHPKRAAFLDDAVRSYRAQTHPRRELLVVNDGPQPLRSTASDVRVINLPAPMSIGEKRNVGLRFAYGDLIATWDDDDIMLASRISTQVAVMERTGADCVLGEHMHVANEQMTVVGRCVRWKQPTMGSVLYRREVLVRAGGYSSASYAEDLEMLERVRMISRGRIVVIPGDWYVMRRHGNNVTLGFGESSDAWIACALRDPERDAAQAGVDAIRALPVGGLE